MRIRFIFFFMLLLFCSSSFATGFLNGFEDIPLMSGFKQISNQDFSFGNEETGYTETIITAQKKFHFNEIRTFYYNSLPTLGWEIKNNDSNKLIFSRERDILEISQIQKQPLKLLISLKRKN